MQFGRVDGQLRWEETCGQLALRFIALIETASGIQVARDEMVDPPADLTVHYDLNWLADQLTQETIGVDLAIEGWEVIGAGDLPTPIDGVGRSALYAVRRT
jgi:hypothetical protein